MKLKKILAIAVTLVMACSALTGCVGIIGETTINADGSGTITASAGFSKQAWDMMEGMDMESNVTDEEEFTYNGTTYIGDVETVSFANPAEFNKYMADVDDNDYGVQSGLFELAKNADGTLTLTLNADNGTGNTDEIESQLTSEDSTLTAEQIQSLMGEFAVVFTFNFPAEVKQTAGETAGVTISGKKLTVDIMKLSEKLGGKSDKLVFTTGTATSAPVVEDKPVVVDKPVTGEYMFSDVNTSDWFCTAVNAMAKGGLVNGVGNGKFAPQDTLTYAQFCQILANAKGLPTGEKNGYWAYKAIESCVDADYVTSVGAEISPAYYDVAITREAAIAAMYNAKASELTVVVNNNVSIPDLRECSPIYAEEIINAYKYGITNGMDEKGTFAPKKSLTRAEICQLFYNLSWTTPAK